MSRKPSVTLKPLSNAGQETSFNISRHCFAPRQATAAQAFRYWLVSKMLLEAHSKIQKTRHSVNPVLKPVRRKKPRKHKHTHANTNQPCPKPSCNPEIMTSSILKSASLNNPLLWTSRAPARVAASRSRRRASSREVWFRSLGCGVRSGAV